MVTAHSLLLMDWAKEMEKYCMEYHKELQYVFLDQTTKMEIYIKGFKYIFLLKLCGIQYSIYKQNFTLQDDIHLGTAQ